MKPLRKTRGVATVEMALSLIVFVPLFLYALFLDDLLRYRLDAQEAVYSTPWDLTGQDFTVKPGATVPSTGATKVSQALSVQHQARLMYCDHESGKNSFTIDSYGTDNDTGNAIMKYPDCEETEHHVGLTSHVCWLPQGAQQVTCNAPVANVGALSEPLNSSYRNQYQVGGMYVCWGREGVQNYILPRYFLPEFSKLPDKGRLTKEQFSNTQYGDNIGVSYGDGTIHGNAMGAPAESTYLLQQEQLALVVDSWALNEPLDISPGTKSGNLYDRVNTVYNGNLAYAPYAAATARFLADLVSQGLLSPLAFKDDPLTPNIGLKPYSDSTNSVTQDSGSRGYFSSPWQDWDTDPYQQTYSNRGNNYMGCQSPESC